MLTDWIRTFPVFFNETHRDLLAQVERTGFDKGVQSAAKCAAAYALESEEHDSICREIAREITTLEAPRT